MAFVNEYISAEDFEKYGLKEIDKKFIVGGVKSRQWTIDRERDIYLRKVVQGAGNDVDVYHEMKWTFYWHNEPITVRLDIIDGGDGENNTGWTHWKLIRVNGSYGLPDELKPLKADFLKDLKEALTAYRSAGVYSEPLTSYHVILDIDGDCQL